VPSGASSSTTSFVDPRSIARYFLVGGTCAVVDIGLFMLFARFMGFPYLRVAAATFIVATLLNYFLSVRFVFVSGLRYTPRWELVMVFAVSLVGLGINQVILSLGVDRWGFDLLVSKLAATGCVFFWNYFARRLIVFGATH
jgi:putative flippase GtrA